MADWSSFITQEWQWSITWGWYQLALGLLCSTTIFMSMRKTKSLPAIILVITSYWSAFIVYLVLMFCSSLYMINIMQKPVLIISSAPMPLILGIFFTLLQIFFVHLVHEWYRVHFQCVLWVTLVGNSMAAAITFLLTQAIHNTEIAKTICSVL
jgi:hypothetical protein